MKVKEFSYELPDELIARYPAEPRDASRLLVLDRRTGKMEHTIFRDIIRYLVPGDVLVFNDARVIPARLKGKLESGAGVEVFLVRRIDGKRWEVLSKPAKKLKPGRKVFFPEATATVIGYAGRGKRIVEFSVKDFDEFLNRVGEVPLPPYIKRDVLPEDKVWYQTVFARSNGAVAAPTAGLHFTTGLIEKIKQLGVKVCFLTLYVGPGTFKPVRAENVEDHKMDEEYFRIPERTADEVNLARKEGRRVIAVGTTVVRALESASDREGFIIDKEEFTGLFIYPGYKFKVIDAMVTNFHLPGSTLIMLVSAFAGKERVMNAYREAVRMRYRFYSFGDAMFVY